MKQAWEDYALDYGWSYREVEVLPKCKKVTNPHGVSEYQLVRRKVFFGLFPITYWTNKNRIRWTELPTVEYYDCDCMEVKE